jgi:hypothetical protein
MSIGGWIVAGLCKPTNLQGIVHICVANTKLSALFQKRIGQ